METKNIFNDFFSYLSCLGNENALSDIIAATCNTSYEFKKLFFDFFFPGENLISKCSSEIEREVTSKDGKQRYDFFFSTNDNEEFIIENKIYDPHDHFKEYTTFFPENHIGFIANYHLDKISYSHKHTWEEFYNILQANIQKFQKTELILINGVINYIREACGIMEQKDFSLNSLNDLGYFIQVLKKILVENGFEINNKAKGSSEIRIGFWTYKEGRSYWFGIYLSSEKKEGFSLWAGIYNYEIKKTSSYNSLVYTDYTNDNSIWFKVKDPIVEKLTIESSYNEKYEIIKNFITEVESIK